MAPRTTEALLEGPRSPPFGSGPKAVSVAEFLVTELSKSLFTRQCCRQRYGFHPPCRMWPVLTRAAIQPDHKRVSWVPLRDSTARLTPTDHSRSSVLHALSQEGLSPIYSDHLSPLPHARTTYWLLISDFKSILTLQSPSTKVMSLTAPHTTCVPRYDAPAVSEPATNGSRQPRRTSYTQRLFESFEFKVN